MKDVFKRGHVLKRNLWSSTAFIFLFLTACSNPTVEESRLRLDELVENGIDSEERTKIEERFNRTNGRDKNAIDILANYADDTALDGKRSDLDTLLNRSLSRNSDIARAAQRLDRSDAKRLNAIYGYLPQVTLTVNSNKIKQEVIQSDNDVFEEGIANYGSEDITFEVSQPIIDMSRIFGIRIAKTVRTNAEVDYIATVQAVMYDVFDTYIQALQADNAVNSLRRRESLLNQQAQAERDRTSEGLTRQNALRGIEIERSDLGIQASRSELERARLLSKLSLMTGSKVAGVSRTAIPTGVAGTERRISVEQATEQAMERNPIVLRSLISVTEAELRNKQARAVDFSPVLVAFARIVDEDREDSRFGGGSVTSDTITGVRLVVPIFNARGEGYQNIETRVDFKDALIQYLNQRRQVETDIAATHQRMRNLAAASGRAQSAVRSNQALVNQELSLQEAGDSQAYLVAALQSRALGAQAQSAELQLEYIRAWARFVYLTGQNIGKR